MNNSKRRAWSVRVPEKTKRATDLYQRKLQCERLEDRRLLTVVTVDTVDDVIDFSDGRTSLREAIFATNTVAGADEIIFDFGFDGPTTILLTQGELQITDDLTINGPGRDLLTIDASGSDPTPDKDNGDGSRVFDIRSKNSRELIEVSLQGLSITDGDQRSGGAIHSEATLTLSDSVRRTTQIPPSTPTAH